MTEKEKIITEYKKEIFKGREKEFLLDDSNKELCEKCGLEIDRDYNASINILNEGLRILEL